MKKLLTAVCAVLFTVSASFALEWGGIFNDNTKLSTQSFDSVGLDQSNAIFFWLKTPVSKKMAFSAELFYKYALSVNNSETSFLNIIDSDLIKLSGDYEAGIGKFSFAAGRFAVADVTSVIFSQVSDGISVKYDLPLVKISAYAGYTGLLNAFSVSMVDSKSDGTANSQIYTLCHGYIPVEAAVTLPALPFNQKLSIGLDVFTDVEQTKNNKFYASLVLSGPLSNIFFYNLTTTFGSVNFSNVMNYSSLMFYLFPVTNIMVVAGAEYASGNNGGLSPFQGITYVASCRAADSPLLSGVILPQVSVSATFGDAFIGGSAKYVIDAAESIGNKGCDLGLNFAYNIFTDLRVGCDISAYLNFADTGSNYFAATLNAALAF